MEIEQSPDFDPFCQRSPGVLGHSENISTPCYEKCLLTGCFLSITFNHDKSVFAISRYRSANDEFPFYLYL